jgi:hypothetical protein
MNYVGLDFSCLLDMRQCSDNLIVPKDLPERGFHSRYSVPRAYFEYGARQIMRCDILLILLIQYSEAISKYAEDKFQRDGVELITSAR